ncbi:unnamed protein product [Linum tenue]|uniref:Protein kinase domain-containing protein n=1 Tax=Linum tenue TaxID=586396 RepID=A0AAV0I5Q8_9ROSI|nr:unnamed protein product [Linum tenue]
MERNLGKAVMDQKNYEQARYSNAETRNEGPSSTSQRFLHDPSTNINTNLRPPDYNVSIRARPVLNYSIQTGEEFALEFMRERVNPQQHFLPNSNGDPSGGSGYMDLKGMLGMSNAGSEIGSDIAMINSVEKGRTQDFERKVVPPQEHDSVRSVPRTSSRNDTRRENQGYTSSRPSDSSSVKVKFLCSFGGTILPRPSDGKLRYVGGETRIIRISKDISWQELVRKTLAICNQPHTIKYQLPGEDLDALVSVSCDEDLQNMMEECSVLDDGGSQKPRMFIFSSNDLEDGTCGLGSVDCDSEIQYVVAVNGMDFGSRKSSINLASASGNNLDELLSLNIERENSRVAAETSIATILPLAVTQTPSTIQSSQPGTLTSSIPSSQPYQGLNTHHLDAGQYPINSTRPAGSLQQLDGKGSNTSNAKKYAIVTDPSGYGTSGETLMPAPLLGHPSQKGGLAEETIQGGARVQNAEASIKDSKLRRDSSSQKIHELDKIQNMDKDAQKELKMKRDGSLHKVNEAVSIPNNVQKEEAAVSNPTTDVGLLVLPTKSNSRPQEGVLNPKNLVEGKKNAGDDRFSSGGSFAPQSEADLTDFSYPEQPVVPQPVFHSERFPREQAELHRLSKSEDSFDPQVLMNQARSGVSQLVNESIDKLHDSPANLLTEQSLPSAKGHHVHPQTIEDGLARFEKYKELADNMSKPSSHVPQVKESKLQKSDSRHVLFNSTDNSETAQTKAKKEGSGLMHSAASEIPGPSSKHLESSAIRSSEFDQSEIASNKNIGSSAKGHMQLPKQQIENPGGAVSIVKSAIIGTPEQITIDINERFSRDFLSDIFSQAKIHENSSTIGPMHVDGAGLSLNMENLDPKRWSYFRNLAQNQFVRKDVSLMDQDHPGFPPSMTTVEGSTPLDYSYPPFKSDGISVSKTDSPINFDEDIQQQRSGVAGTQTLDYSHSQLKAQESVQLDGINSRIPESAYEDGKSDVNNTAGLLLDISLGDFDISTLQIIKNEDLEELRELGSGTFGTVYHGKWRGSDVAIKRIKKSCFTGRSSEQERLTIEFWREADILSKLHHPNVVAFYGVVQDGPGGTMATVTEYMVNGSLRHVLLSKERHLDRRKRLIIAMDAAFGMEYLHSKNIVHFDLKCDNLLVNLKDPLRPICKVGDFGLSKIKRNTLVTGGVRGTLPWMAPELLNGSSSKVSEKVDVFSFGIVLWEILTGEEPYANMHYGAIIGGIVNNTLRPPVPGFCDPEWKLLMEQCWAPDPLARPAFTEIARRLRVMSAAASQTRQQNHQPQNQAHK